jgi:hypothetical protein
MAKDTPIKKAKLSLSSAGTAARVAAAERAATAKQPQPAEKAPTTKTPAYKPKQKFVDARKAEIEAQRAADRAAIAAKKKKTKKYARGGKVRGCGLARKGVRKARML